MTPLVTLEQAKGQVFSTQAEDDAQIDLLMQVATGIVVDYVGLDPVTGAARTWTEADVPDPIRMAILLQIAELWAHRGDQEQEGPWNGELSPVISRLLARYRDPVVA